MISQFFFSKKYFLGCYSGWIICFITCLLEGRLVYLANLLGRKYNGYMESILNPTEGVEQATRSDFLLFIFEYFYIQLIGAAFIVTIRYFVGSHLAFKWRTSLNDYYLQHWKYIRKIEGASQRIQDDCSKFAEILEHFILAMMSQLVRIVSMYKLVLMYSEKITSIPIFGSGRYSLIFGSFCIELCALIPLLIAGHKLPQIEFENQICEAAFRKELILGEDDENMCDTSTVSHLFKKVKSNSYKMYLHLTYVDASGHLVNSLEWYICGLLLAPALVRGELSFSDFSGADSAIISLMRVLSTIRSYWPEFVELASIYKRLKGFENAIESNLII